MYVIKNKLLPGLGIGLAGGVLLAFLFINPYQGEILLSEAVLQLSGSSGEFALLPVFRDLISFTIRLLPNYIFEMYLGTELYRHFCTASIYVFSRTPHRIRWYMKEVAGVWIVTLFVQMMQMFASIFVTALRYQVVVNQSGIVLMLFHIVVYAMWFFAMTLLLNLLAIQFGSNHAFLIVGGIQFAFTALLELVNLYEIMPQFGRYFLNYNPIAHLVVGWHTGRGENLREALNTPYRGLYMESSLFWMLGISVVVIVCGIYLVWKHDFLNTYTEGERI